MARLPRLNPSGVAQHLIQRGNNRQACFCAEEDYSAYRSWLGEYAKKFGMAIHAYVLMTNHVHILATPKRDNSISKTMGAFRGQTTNFAVRAVSIDQN